MHLRSTTYMVGLNKLNFSIKGDFLVVEVGNDQWERFASYITQNNQYILDRLTLLSIANGDLSFQDIIERKMSKEHLLDPADSAYMSLNASTMSKDMGLGNFFTRQ